MAKVVVTDRALRDLERLFDFLAATDLRQAVRQIDTLPAAFAWLADHPLLGRPAEHGRRELVVSRGHTGYVAKYRWWPDEDVVLILAVRQQREAGYGDET